MPYSPLDPVTLPRDYPADSENEGPGSLASESSQWHTYFHCLALFFSSLPFFHLSLRLFLGLLWLNSIIWGKNNLGLFKPAYIKNTDYMESKEEMNSEAQERALRSRNHSKAVPLKKASDFSSLAFRFRGLRDCCWLLDNRCTCLLQSSCEQEEWSPVSLGLPTSGWWKGVILVCWGCCTKALQTRWLEQKFTFSHV